jgi:hypothetical protein
MHSSSRGGASFDFVALFVFFWGERYAANHAYDVRAKYKAASVIMHE